MTDLVALRHHSNEPESNEHHHIENKLILFHSNRLKVVQFTMTSSRIFSATVKFVLHRQGKIEVSFSDSFANRPFAWDV